MRIKFMIHMKWRLHLFCARKRDFEVEYLQPDLTTCKLSPNVTFNTCLLAGSPFPFCFDSNN